MRTLTPKKIGVLSVLGVPETLKASNGGTFSHGTPTAKHWNTNLQEHQWCSSPYASKANAFGSPDQHQQRARENTTLHPLSPAGRSWSGLRWRIAARFGAEMARGIWGMGAWHAAKR